MAILCGKCKVRDHAHLLAAVRVVVAALARLSATVIALALVPVEAAAASSRHLLKWTPKGSFTFVLFPYLRIEPLY